MPILHLSQLVGVAAGFEESELKFKRHVVSVEAGAREAPGLRGQLSRPRARLRSPRLGWGGSRRAGRACACSSGLPGLPRELDGAAHRAPLRLPPRRALAGRARGRARGRVGGRAGARPRLRHRRPASRGRAGCRCSSSCCAQLGSPFVVLGNHDHAVSRDPFSRPVSFDDLVAGRLLSRRERRGRAARLPGRGRRSRSALVAPPRRSGFEPSDAPISPAALPFSAGARLALARAAGT